MKLPLLFASFLLLCGESGLAKEGETRIVFIEPAKSLSSQDLPVYQIVTDAARIGTYEGWMANESARMAIDLYARAWTLSSQGKHGASPIYYVALVPGGNHAAVGLRFLKAPDLDAHARTSFIKLAPEEWVFSTTLLHETGHVILSMLHDGAETAKREIAAIPHTTAALTDRGTAFDEGFAIHLETLAAHFTADPYLKDRYYHQRFRFGIPDLLGEFHRHVGDLLSFSQTIARYIEVRENNFAFSPAYVGPDYLRVQLEKSRNFASLRDANQLLQSEGFHASFFFSLLMRGDVAPSLDLVRERQEAMLEVMAEMLGSGAHDADDPLLLHFVETYLRKFPDEASDIVDVLLDLSHGVFVDSNAAHLWREHYLGALRLDLAERDNEQLEAARMRWRTEVAGDTKVLYRNLGPQIRAELVGSSVMLIALEESSPLSFDVNTVEEGILRLVTNGNEAEIASWLGARREKPFTDVSDFRRRAGLATATQERLIFP